MLGSARLLSSILAALCIASPLGAQTVRPDCWGAIGGQVTSIARVGDALYIAGPFAYIGPSTGGGVALDPESGAPQRPYPRVAGTVLAVVPDGARGWFIGGDFTGVEGEPRRHLAYVKADGTLSPWRADVTDPRTGRRAWDPNPIGVVSALAHHGNTLYVGGKFEEIAGASRRYLAAIDARTGALLPWAPQPDGPVMSLAVHGDRLYVGGRFQTIGGAPRRNVAALDALTGEPAPWRPDASGAVLAFGFHGQRVFVGGEFDDVGGRARNSIAELDAASGAATEWDAQLKPLRRYLAHGDWIWPFVSSLVIRGGTLYAGGDFDSVGGARRYDVAAVELDTARPTRFDARMYGGYVKSLALHGGALYVGGYLYDIGGTQRPNLAALDARTGDATAFDPRCYGRVMALAVDGRSVYAGGDFTSVYEWESRPRLAALDVATGRPLPWNPKLDTGQVTGMIGAHGRLYVAGSFGAVDGQPRGHLASFDGATGELTDWNPWTGGNAPGSTPILAMAMVGESLYVGGRFGSINGVPHRSLAAFHATSGALLDWAPPVRGGYPSVFGTVTAMTVRGDTLFVAGEYDTIGGAPRRNLSAISAATGQAYAFDTQPGFPNYRSSFPVYRTIVAGDAGVFAGGYFGYYDDRHHVALVAYDALGDSLPLDFRIDATDWILGSKPQVRHLELRDGTLFVAGRFDEVGGRDIVNLAILDAVTGVPLEWNPEAGTRPGWYDGGVESTALDGDVLYVGGSFLTFGGYPQACVSAVSLTPAPKSERRARPLAAASTDLHLAPARPNPAATEVRLGFVLPQAAVATLAVYDLQGRRVALPIDTAPLPAGAHEVRVPTSDWKAGCYFYSLGVAGRRVTKRMVVVH